MKYLFTTLIAILCISYVHSQRFQITSSHTTNIEPHYSKEPGSTFDTVHILLKLLGDYDPANAENNKVIFEILRFNLPNQLSVISSSFAFPAAVWPGSRGLPGLDTVLIVSLAGRSLTDTLQHDETGHIIIKGDPQHFHAVRLTNSASSPDTRYKGNKPFWVEIGSNFDLIDGPEPNNFFSGVFFHKRDIRPFFFKKHNSYNKNMGIFAGVFESKSITSITEQTFSLREYYDSTSFLPGVKDSLKTFKGIGSLVNKRTVRNLGLFFSPQIRLTNNSANQDGLHLFTSFWMELQWQKIQEVQEFSQLRILDSTNRHIDSVLGNNKYNAKNFRKESDIRSHYFGIGLPIFYRETFQDNNVHLFVNPIIGISNQPTSEYLAQQDLFEQQNNGPKFIMQKPKREWNPFYVIQFRLNEENYGISFTGEVRGLLKTDQPPFVSIALSKKFDLTKFIEFNK